MPTPNHEKFFELSDDMLCTATKSGYFSSVNQSFTDLLGYSKAELLSIPLIELIHPDDREKTREKLDEMQADNTRHYVENRYQTKAGDYLTFAWIATYDAETKLVYAIARNVTEQTNIKNRLLQVESALKERTIYVETDVNGLIQVASDTFCKISGYAREELIGRTHKIINSGLHPDSFFKELWETISKGDIWSGIIKNKKKDGGIYIVQTLIVPITDHEQKVVKHVAIRQDITENLSNESELARIISVLNETNSIAKVGGWELEVATGELTWTDETFNILEVDKLDSQKPVLDEGLQLFTPKAQPIIEAAVGRAINEGIPYAFEIEGQTAKGNVKWVYTNGKPNFVDGVVKTLSGTIQDIHSRKIAELAYTKERQRSIHNAKLASLGELAASMAHEINNPLGIISGYTELLLENQSVDDDAKSKLGTILKSSDRITHIVKRLRKFSTFNQEREVKPVSLKQLVMESVQLAKTRLKNELVKVQIDLDVECTINCNEIEIEQVLLNLINNSIDAVQGETQKWISIDAHLSESFVVIQVMDSGKPIESDVSAEFFEPFFTTKAADKGTGLGLAISREITEEHGGSLLYEPIESKTCFKIKLPVHAEGKKL